MIDGHPTNSPCGLLRHGHASEAAGDFVSALAHYDEAIAPLRVLPCANEETRRALGVALMNRGNVLQKLAAASSSDEPQRVGPCVIAVAAYDEAIAVFRTLPVDTTPAHRNHLGAAWLNRGHALLTANDPASAADSFEQSIAVLRHLPLEENPAYRLNLAGAWTNLAHALLSTPLHAFPRAYATAQTALDLLANFERTQSAFAEMSLRARRALVTAIGELLVIAENSRQPTAALANAASDAIDDGLALAREWERRGATQLRGLAARLFRLGAQLYGAHQPHFMAEYIFENLAPLPPGGTFAPNPEFPAIAIEAIDAALATCLRPQLLISGEPRAEKLLATVRSLRAARQRLSPPSTLAPTPIPVA